MHNTSLLQRSEFLPRIKPPNNGLIWPFIFEPIKHIYKLCFNKRYRQYRILESRLARIKRHTECCISIGDLKLSFPDSASFLSQFNEIFVNEIYSFRFHNLHPRILDIGANIGMSVVYFKHIFPYSSITALEPDPYIFNFLERNIYNNKIYDIDLINKAAWNSNSQLNFRRDGADGGRLSHSNNQSTIAVDTIDMNEFLIGRHFDFIKMDIEGAEGTVLESCSEYLSSISYIFIEYHSIVGRRQDLDRIMAILSKAGFRVHVQSIIHSPSPFIRLNIHEGYDLQLNIFGWREQPDICLRTTHQ
jgi:FkbM family methyltransferase